MICKQTSLQRVQMVVVSVLCGLLLLAWFVDVAYADKPVLRGVGALDILYNPHDGYVYLLNSNDTVSVVDESTIIKTIQLPTGTFSRLTDFAVADNGDIYISQWYFDQVIVLRDQQIYGIVPRQNDGIPTTNGIENGPVAVATNPVNHLTYVATAWSNEPEKNGVTVLDGLSVTTHITTGVSPQAVTVHPTSGLVFVANSGSDTVAVISHTVVISLKVVGDNPMTLALDPVHERLYVVNRDSNTVTVLSAVTPFNIIGSVPVAVGQDPMAIYADSQSGRAFVVSREDNAVTIINGISATTVATVTVGNNPLAVTGIPSSGLVYIANQVSNSVSVIQGESVTATIPVGTSPVAFAYDPIDGLYVVNFQDASFSLIQGTDVVTTVKNLPRLAYSSIVPLSNGQVIIADHPGEEIHFVEGRQILTRTETVTTPLQMSDLPVRFIENYNYLQVSHKSVAIDDAGYIYVGNFVESTVSIFSDTGDLVDVVNVYGQPYDLEAIPGTGKVYVTIGSGVTILEGAPDTTATLHAINLSGARALAVWPGTNHVYIVRSPGNGSASVAVMDTGSQTVTQIIPICSTPAAIAIDPMLGYGYVTCSGSHSIGVISPTAWLGEVPAVWFPQNVVVNEHNHYAYVTDPVGDQVIVLQGTEFKGAVPLLGSPFALDVDSAGHVFVTTETGNSIAVISGTQLLTTFPTGLYPDSILAADNGLIYVGNAHSGNVDIFQFDQLAEDPSSDWQSAKVITTGTVYANTIEDEDDIDWFQIPITQPGSYITVTLGGLPLDYDLAFFNPLSNAGTTTSTLETLDLSQITAGGSLQALSSWVDLGQLRSLPYSRGGIGGLSSNSLLQTEVIADRIWVPGNYYIAVWGFNGAHSDQPYTLRTEVKVPTEVYTPTAPVQPTSTPPPVNLDVRTIIVTHRTRLEAQYQATRTATLLTGLQTLAQAVSGTVVYLNTYPDVSAAYTQWLARPDDPLAANYVADIIKYILEGMLSVSYPNAEYIVLVGNDSVIPFRRVPDMTLVANEQHYDAGVVATSAMQARLEGGYILSDNFYASYHPLPWQGRELYIPEYAIGRLVETPEEILAGINAYLDPGSTPTIQNALVTGYDFLLDEGQAISQSLGTAGVTVTQLITNGWSAQELRPLLFSGANNLVSLNGHFNHFLLVAGDVSSTIAVTEVVSATGFEGALVISIGCQSGLNIPDWDKGNRTALDFAQAFWGQGAAYIANTGYGYGDSDAIGYSEILAVNLVDELMAEGSVPIGEALLRAKQAYYTDVGFASFGAYDEKVLVEWTLYGLPMQEFGAPSAFNQTSLATPETHTWPQNDSPVAFTQLTAISVTITSSFSPVIVTRPASAGMSVIGAYQQTESIIARQGMTLPVQSEVEMNPGRPLQPRITLDVSENGLVAHGVLFVSGQYIEESFDPVISRIVSDTALVEPPFTLGRWYPVPMQMVNRLQLGDRFASEKLVVIPTQYLEGTTGTGAERRYSDLVYELLYFPKGGTDDFTPPIIEQVRVMTTTSQISFTVTVTDPSGVISVVVAYDTGNGVWQTFALTQASDEQWVGVGPANLQQAFVQAVDAVGNVALSDNKGVYFRAVALDVTTSSQPAWIEPGQDVIFRPVVTNQGGASDTFLVTVNTALDWAPRAQPAMLTLLPGFSTSFAVTLTVPPQALSGTENHVVITVTSLSNQAVARAVTNTVFVAQVAAAEWSSNPIGYVGTNQTVTITHILTNTGNGPDDTFVLSATQGSVVFPALVSLPRGESALVTVTLTVPPCVISGTQTTAHLTATSLFDPDYQAVVTDTMSIVATPGVMATPGYTGTVTEPGASFVFTHVLTNSGNLTDTFNVSVVSAHGWPIPSPAPLTIGSCQTQMFAYTLTAPAVITMNVSDLVTVMISSTWDPAVSVRLTDTLRVNVDLVPPVLTVPSTIITEAIGPFGAEVSYTVTVTDNLDPQPTHSCVPPSASIFPLGLSTVNCTATDASGNSASADFPIHVVDTTSPTLHLPEDMTFITANPQGVVVTYVVTATDIVDSTPDISCAPPSGALFPIGITSVLCIAEDDHGNQVQGTFTVTVQSHRNFLPLIMKASSQSMQGNFPLPKGTAKVLLDRPKSTRLQTVPGDAARFLDSLLIDVLVINKSVSIVTSGRWSLEIRRLIFSLFL